MDHNVTMRNAPTEDDEGKGMQAIVRALLKNPVAAFELLAIFGAGYGLYYANTKSIEDAKASSEAHYLDLKNMVLGNNERVLVKIEALTSNDLTQTQRTETIYSRGDLRWGQVQTKLAEADVKFARIESALNYIVRAVDKSALPLGEIPSK